jgi:hypothetical protein
MAGFAGHFCSLSTGENVLDPIARNGDFLNVLKVCAITCSRRAN